MPAIRVADETIAVAKAAVQRAEQSGAPQAAPVELASARDKLARAEKENADHHAKPAIDTGGPSHRRRASGRGDGAERARSQGRG